MDSGQRIDGYRRAKKIVGFKITNGFPKRREKAGADLQAGFAGNFAIGQAEEFELVFSDGCGFALLLVGLILGSRRRKGLASRTAD